MEKGREKERDRGGNAHLTSSSWKPKLGQRAHCKNIKTGRDYGCELKSFNMHIVRRIVNRPPFECLLL